VLRVAILAVHVTAGELSLPMAVWVACIAGPMWASSTVSCSNTPAISRSEFVIVPPGFESETTESVTSLGHWTRHTIGWSSRWPPNQTPPAPQALASQYPM
jgi:hypothetical protein